MTDFAIVLAVAAVIALPFALLARWLRVYPRMLLVYVTLIPAAASTAVLASPETPWLSSVLIATAAINGVLAAVFLADGLTLPSQRAFSAERHVVRTASLRKPHPVSLTLLNHTRRAFRVRVRDGVPHELNPEPDELSLTLTGHSRSTLRYMLRPAHRGAFMLEQIHLQVRSRLGFWQRQLDYMVASAIHVYPDMKQLGQYALLARTNRLSLLGVRRTRRIGQDHDFERLRDYTIDDNHKHIDWRATARRQKLTVKDFQSSQSQRIIFLLDCGRMMTNEAAGLSLLDHGLNAMLMLSYVALRQGDSVGMVTFSDEIHSYVPSRSGMNQMNRLLHASFDRVAQLTESRYDQAFRYLASHCRKRSLVVLITNVIDEVNSAQIERYMTNLVGRHLPLSVLLRDRSLFDAVDVEQPREEELWPAAAAADILTWRHQVLTDLQSKGVLSLDVFPENLTAPLVNRYLEIKARHLL